MSTKRDEFIAMRMTSEQPELRKQFPTAGDALIEQMARANAEQEWRRDRQYDYTEIIESDYLGNEKADTGLYAIKSYYVDRRTNSWTTMYSYAELIELRDQINDIERRHNAAEQEAEG